MLRISEAQLSALEAHYNEEFFEQMTDDLFDAFPAKCKKKGRDRVLTFVRGSVARVRESVGTAIESDYRLWVVTEFVLGPKVTREICDKERERLLARDGRVDPTLLVILTYQEMFAKLDKTPPEPPPDPEFLPVDEASI